jgi:hypothetical protein
MSQIKNIVVAVIALVIIYFFTKTANMMGAPNIFTLVAGLMVIMVLWNVAKSLIRGY